MSGEVRGEVSGAGGAELSSEVASLSKKEAALIFISCYVANDTTLNTVATKLLGCKIFSDEGNYPSMIQGIRNSHGSKHIFKHNNPQHLEVHAVDLYR